MDPLAHLAEFAVDFIIASCTGGTRGADFIRPRAGGFSQQRGPCDAQGGRRVSGSGGSVAAAHGAGAFGLRRSELCGERKTSGRSLGPLPPAIAVRTRSCCGDLSQAGSVTVASPVSKYA